MRLLEWLNFKHWLLALLYTIPFILHELHLLLLLLVKHLLQLQGLALVDESNDDGCHDARYREDERFDEHLAQAENATAFDQSPGLGAGLVAA